VKGVSHVDLAPGNVFSSTFSTNMTFEFPAGQCPGSASGEVRVFMQGSSTFSTNTCVTNSRQIRIP